MPAMDRPLIFIDGDQGTTGLQIVSRLRQRDDLRLLRLPEAQRKCASARSDAINRCDIAILCLPDEAARDAVAQLRSPQVRVLDASSAHRTAEGWVYGLAELTAGQDRRIAAAARVSNPGCYPTGALALLRPLAEAGLLPPQHPVTIHAVSGYSGRGRSGIEAYEGGQATTAPALQVYGLALQHKHVPEIQQHALLPSRPVFVPAYGAYRQGIVLTIPLHLQLLPEGCTAQRVHELLHAHHRQHPHVQLLTPAQAAGLSHLDPQALNGRDDMLLAVLGDGRHGQLLLAAVFDNLGKGAAGAAVQNLGLMLQAAARA